MIMLSILVFLTMPTLKLKWRKQQTEIQSRPTISVVSKHQVGTARSLNPSDLQNLMVAGNYAWNEMDSHDDTCCTGANWTVLELTGEVCEVMPFLESYDPVEEIPMAMKCDGMDIQ
jgi:hypothetical protein